MASAAGSSVGVAVGAGVDAGAVVAVAVGSGVDVAGAVVGVGVAVCCTELTAVSRLTGAGALSRMKKYQTPATPTTSAATTRIEMRVGL